MKRVKHKILISLFAVAMAFSLTACGDKACEHTYDNACDTICNLCSEERTTTHTPNADDGNCLTEITCSVCGTVTTEAKENHTPNADDGDCLTEITCSVCGIITTEAKETHTLEKGIDNGDGTHSPACQYCDYVDTATTEEHSDYIDENCICTVCSLAVHTVDSTTGICSVCGDFAAAASITVDGVKTYYATFDEAIAYANGKDGTVMVIENDCYITNVYLRFTSGNVTIDLNGKTIDSTSNYSIPVNGATVTIRDSVGGGKTLETVGGWSGTLIIEGGTHSYISNPKNLIITGGEFASVTSTIEDTVTISGGSFEKIGVNSRMGTLADMLADVSTTFPSLS